MLVPKKPYQPRDSAKRARTAATSASPTAESAADVARRQLPGLEASLADLRARGLAEDSPQITYHLQQIDRLRANLQTGGDTPRRQTPREGDSSA